MDVQVESRASWFIRGAEAPFTFSIGFWELERIRAVCGEAIGKTYKQCLVRSRKAQDLAALSKSDEAIAELSFCIQMERYNAVCYEPFAKEQTYDCLLSRCRECVAPGHPLAEHAAIVLSWDAFYHAASSSNSAWGCFRLRDSLRKLMSQYRSTGVEQFMHALDATLSYLAQPDSVQLEKYEERNSLRHKLEMATETLSPPMPEISVLNFVAYKLEQLDASRRPRKERLLAAACIHWFAYAESFGLTTVRVFIQVWAKSVHTDILYREYLQTDKMIADILTKPLAKPKTEGFVAGWNLKPLAKPKIKGFVAGLNLKPLAKPKIKGFVAGLNLRR
ncbi:hypothetical protein HDU89_008921 [Geranomyces variabilis]|nr:hypothetical protein HDU89_008921 [Geranomyces variabilis]